MGKRSGTQTVVAVVQAFLKQRTWSQAELGRYIGVSTPTLSRCLRELEQSAFPLQSEREHPHVYWSVPKGWFPGGILFQGTEVSLLLRLLARSAKTEERDRLLRRVLEALPKKDGPEAPTAVVPPAASAGDLQFLPVVEDAAERRRPLQFRYLTASTGVKAQRHASVLRVFVGPPSRFVAFCHKSGELRWFRLENVLDARVDEREPFRDVPSTDVDAYVGSSFGGFRDGSPVRAEFFVRDPESRWVQNNLPAPMNVEAAPGGILVATETAGLMPLARFVVGLGGAARPTTPELIELVRTLAQGALAQL